MLQLLHRHRAETYCSEGCVWRAALLPHKGLR